MGDKYADAAWDHWNKYNKTEIHAQPCFHPHGHILASFDGNDMPMVPIRYGRGIIQKNVNCWQIIVGIETVCKTFSLVYACLFLDVCFPELVKAAGV